MFEPKRILITRHGDAQHENLERTPGMIVGSPSVGECLQIFFDDGKVMTTSAVKRIANDGDDTVVETRNSQYRLKLAS